MVAVVDDIHAFRLASQKSELRRILLLFGIVGVLLVLTLVRHAAGGIAAQGRPFLYTLVILAVVAAYSGVVFRIVRRADRDKRLLSGWVWSLSAIAEALFPTAALFCLVRFVPIEPLKALVA